VETSALLIHGVNVLRFEVDAVPDGFSRFMRNLERHQVSEFLHWVVDYGQWNEIVVDEWRSSTYEEAQTYAFWTPRKWEQVLTEDSIIVTCYMSPSALMHHMLKFGD
jgi:hypothetical protein